MTEVCFICKTEPQQGELFLCLYCEELVKKAHDIQQALLVKAEEDAIKTEVVYEPYFVLAEV